MGRINGLLPPLLILFLSLPTPADERDRRERDLSAELTKAVAAEFDKAEAQTNTSFPSVFQLRDAAQAFTAAHHDAQAVAFLKQAAVTADGSRTGSAEQLTACIGLALLAEKHDTTSFFASHIGDRDSPLSWIVSAAVAFLPAGDARRLAEEVAADGQHHYQTRIRYLFLLRAVGDQETLEKLATLQPAGESPRVLEVRDRTVWFIKRRLSLDKPEDRERWERLELAFCRMGRWGPGYRSWKPGLAWGAEQMHRFEPDIPVEFLEARLSLERTRLLHDHNVSHEVPLAAALAALQGRTELLPLLDEWAATDFGWISQACASAAGQLRNRKE